MFASPNSCLNLHCLLGVAVLAACLIYWDILSLQSCVFFDIADIFVTNIVSYPPVITDLDRSLVIPLWWAYKVVCRHHDDLLPSPNPIILNQILTWLKRLNSELFFCIVDSDNEGCDRYSKFWSVEACPKYRTCYPMKLRC